MSERTVIKGFNPIIYQRFIYRDDLKANPSVLYVFGDNEKRVGLGGQAKEMRGEPNAAGIATLYAPGQYWSDEAYDHNVSVIRGDLFRIVDHLNDCKLIVFPSDGVGTGLSAMKHYAPKTFDYLERVLRDNGIKNGVR